MATQNISAQAKEGNTRLAWEQEQPVRQKMAREIKEHILDPFALVSSWLKNIDEDKGYPPSYDEIGKLLALMVMGAHNELDMHCAYGGHFSPPLSDCLEAELKRGAA